MANKKRRQDSQAPRQMTRGQLSRHQRELAQQRQLYFVMAGIGVLVALVLIAAVFDTYVRRPNVEVGKVGNESIARGTYNKHRSWQIY
ncbi:MAG TPA: hypothetical protein VM536_01370, partial [Chloroflexia bacterium]|nr:hypothetical protein [Chloroflexia bacterium]